MNESKRHQRESSMALCGWLENQRASLHASLDPEDSEEFLIADPILH